jgi:DNA-binding response OmpR family regulator
MIQIDDKTVTTDLDRAGYRKMGVFVRAAANYEEARKIMKAEKIDLVVINLDFAAVDGALITRHLKAQEDSQNVPIVLTSVRTSARVRAVALEAGADLFVEQPLPRQYFIEKLKQLLEQRTRTNERVEGPGEAHFQVEGSDISCPIGDLSQTGMLLSTDQEIPDGTEIKVEFELPGSKKPLRIKGTVVRTLRSLNQTNGVGIRFLEFLGDSERRLERYIAKTSQGDELMLWSDWSRDAAFPAGLDEATVKSLAAKLPAGMPIYAGISTNAMMTMYSDKLTIDDALVTMGSTLDEKKAWDECMGKAQSMLGMIEGGAVMGVSMNDATTTALISLRVKDAAAFRTTLADTMALLAKTGWGTVKLENAGDTMTLTTTANAQRVKDVMDVFNTGPVAEEVAAAQEQALAQATQPQTIVMTFKGNEVLMTQSQGGKPMDMAAKPGATDIRNTLGANAWGTADWFATLELRALMANIMAQPGIEGLEAFKDLANGMPVTVRAWQGVQGNTTRLTLQANLKEVQTFVADIEAAAKKAEAKAGKDEDEDDDDDDEDEDEKDEGKEGAKPGQDKD